LRLSGGRIFEFFRDGGGPAAGRRAQIAQRFLSGEWGVELESFDTDFEAIASVSELHLQRLERPS